MKFDLKNLNPGAWFDLGDARVCLRSVNADKMREIDSLTTKPSVDVRKGQRFQYDKVTDPILRRQLMWDYMIVDWQNILDGEGNPLPCVKENKLTLMNGSPEFLAFVMESLKLLGDAEERQAEELEKNSETTQGE